MDKAVILELLNRTENGRPVFVVRHNVTYHMAAVCSYENSLGGLTEGVFDVVVPKGFETDFASTPKWLWGFPFFLTPLGKWAKASLLHDYMYKTHTLLVGEGENSTPVTRRTSDRIFRDQLEEADVSFLSRTWLYYGVRLFGKKAWDRAKVDEGGST